MYFKGGNYPEYHEFVGWVKDATKFMEVMNDEVELSSEVQKYLLDETYKQAEEQARSGTKEFPINGYWHPDYYISNRQECLENIAKAAILLGVNRLCRTKEKQMFVFGPELGGVYVFKQVY